MVAAPAATAGVIGVHLPDPTHGSVLLALWFEVLLIALTALVLLVVVAVEVRRHDRRRADRRTVGRWWMAGWRALAAALALTLVVADVADVVNRHYSYIPSFDALAGRVGHDGGRASVAFARVGPGGGARREAIARRDDAERQALLRSREAA